MQVFQLADVINYVIESDIIFDRNLAFRLDDQNFLWDLREMKLFLQDFLFKVKNFIFNAVQKLNELVSSFVFFCDSCELAINDILWKSPVGGLDPEVDCKKKKLKYKILSEFEIFSLHELDV